jgi:hypothetical protein
MPYSQQIAGRVRRALGERTDVVEKAMFGGVTFMIAGNMCCGVHRDDLILRLDPAARAEELGNHHARMWDFMKRPMPGMFAVAAEGCAKQASVDRLVNFALQRVLSLPAKDEKKARAQGVPGKSIQDGRKHPVKKSFEKKPL